LIATKFRSSLRQPMEKCQALRGMLNSTMHKSRS
jgi:hypothetical protein